MSHCTGSFPVELSENNHMSKLSRFLFNLYSSCTLQRCKKEGEKQRRGTNKCPYLCLSKYTRVHNIPKISLAGYLNGVSVSWRRSLTLVLATKVRAPREEKKYKGGLYESLSLLISLTESLNQKVTKWRILLWANIGWTLNQPLQLQCDCSLLPKG